MFDQIVDPESGKLHNVNSKKGQKIINNYRIALKGGSGCNNHNTEMLQNAGGKKQTKTLLKRLDNDLKKNNIGNKKSSPRPKNNKQKSNKNTSKKSGKTVAKQNKTTNKSKKINKNVKKSNKSKYGDVKVGQKVTLANGACAIKQSNGRFKFIKRSDC